TVNARRFQSH
ncbi:hypothetical protein VCHC72A2_03411B, partial [Vibrio cholerae HC-72A2]